MPPDAFTATDGGSDARISETAGTVAPPAWPVDVLAKSAPAAATSPQASTISSSLSWADSMIAFTTASPRSARAASTTADRSSPAAFGSPSSSAA